MDLFTFLTGLREEHKNSIELHWLQELQEPFSWTLWLFHVSTFALMGWPFCYIISIYAPTLQADSAIKVALYPELRILFGKDIEADRILIMALIKELQVDRLKD